MGRASVFLAAMLTLGSGACEGDIVDEGPDAQNAPGLDARVGAVDATSLPDATTASPGDLLGAFQMTYYWVTTEEEFSGAADTNLYDDSCNVISTVPEAFADSLALEGTGRLRDGRLLNYWGSCSCPRSPCFFELASEFPWGIGVMNIPLEPFRSVAVDTDVIDIGTGLYVAELDGLVMPGDAPTGGFRHDGCVVAVDVGGGIGGMHIDFFAGLRPYYVDVVGQVGGGDVALHDGGDRCPDRSMAAVAADTATMWRGYLRQ